MKVNIIGNVIGPKGKLHGIVELPNEEAERLLRLKCAERVFKEESVEEKPVEPEKSNEPVPEDNSTKTTDESEETEEAASKSQNSKKKKN